MLCLDANLVPDFAELVVETGPTQTQKYPVADQPSDQITNAIQEYILSLY